ncbi:MAG: ATP-binding cassette domain-containing protein, partial [Firmicutes bacterium]|nr:ATP-binding cassette domain-containing protein [Bacillota bacterium]
MALLTAKDLVLGYETRIMEEDLKFQVEEGDYLCIAGENGSGKSTLMKTLLGLQSPISGTITTGDGLRPSEIGYLPQQTIVQKDFPASVTEVVLSGCQGRMGLRPFYNKEDKALAKENMELMGISG